MNEQSITRYVMTGCLAIALATGCEHPRTASAHRTLPPAPAAVCDDGTHMLLELAIDSGYALNKMPLDSAALAKWIARDFPQFPPIHRNLLISDTDSARAHDVDWGVAAVEAQHGHAYRYVDPCFKPVALSAGAIRRMNVS